MPTHCQHGKIEQCNNGPERLRRGSAVGGTAPPHRVPIAIIGKQLVRDPKRAGIRESGPQIASPFHPQFAWSEVLKAGLARYSWYQPAPLGVNLMRDSPMVQRDYRALSTTTSDSGGLGGRELKPGAAQG